MKEGSPICLLVGFLHSFKSKSNQAYTEESTLKTPQVFKIEREFMLICNISRISEPFKGSKHEAILTDGKITAKAYFVINSNHSYLSIDCLTENQLIRIMSAELTVEGDELTLVISEFQKFITEEWCKHKFGIKLDTSDRLKFSFSSPSRKSNMRNKSHRLRDSYSAMKNKERVRFDIPEIKPRSKSFAKKEENKISSEESKSLSNDNIVKTEITYLAGSDTENRIKDQQ